MPIRACYFDSTKMNPLPLLLIAMPLLFGLFEDLEAYTHITHTAKNHTCRFFRNVGLGPQDSELSLEPERRL